MEFFKKLNEALRAEGFNAAQIKKIITGFDSLNPTEILAISSDSLLPVVPGSNSAEKTKNLKKVLSVLKKLSVDFAVDPRRIVITNRPISRLILERKNELQKVGINSLLQLKQWANKSDSEIINAGFSADERKTLRNFAELSKVFPPDVAIILQEDQKTSLSDLVKLKEDEFVKKLESAGTDSERAKFEFSRVKRLQTIAGNMNNLRKFSGIEVDLASGEVIPDADKKKLKQKNIETLHDWISQRNDIKLSVKTTRVLDAYSRLYNLEVNSDLATTFISKNILSATQIMRLSSKGIKKASDQLNIPVKILTPIVSKSSNQVKNAAAFLDLSMISKPEQPHDWIKDIINIPDNIKFCLECDEHQSAFSKFAYFVYLIQRTRKTPDELEKNIIDNNLKTTLKEIFKDVISNSALPEGFFIRHITPSRGLTLIPDPLASCDMISIIDLLIRKLQKLLEDMQVNRTMNQATADFSYLRYNEWRGERMAYFYPELKALWRDDVLTGDDGPLNRESIIENGSVVRPILQNELHQARKAMEAARLRTHSGTNLSVTANIYNNSGLFIAESPAYFADFDNGLKAMEHIIGADKNIEDALNSLDAEQPGLSVLKILEAKRILDDVAKLVFESTSPWVMISGNHKSIDEILMDLPPANRRFLMANLFNELISGGKRIFRPSARDFKVNGVSESGAIEIDPDWRVTGNFEQSGTGIEKSKQGTSWLVNKDGTDFTNYLFESDVILDSELVNNDSFGLAIRLVNPGNFPREGYRAIVRQVVTGNNQNSVTRHEFVLQMLKTDNNGQLVITDLKKDEIGFFAISDDVALNTNDPDRKLLTLGDLYSISISCSGKQITARFRRSASRVIELQTENQDYDKGTFGFFSSQRPELRFRNASIIIEGQNQDSLPPFYVNRKATNRNVLDDRMYLDHFDGKGMKISDLENIKLTSVSTDFRSIRLREAKSVNNNDNIFILIGKGGLLPDLRAMDILLEKLLASMFYFRFVVIPVRLAQAYQLSGSYEPAVKQLSLIYDDKVKTGELERHIYPLLAFPENDILNRKTSQDVRLIRLRLGEILLEWADWLFRQDTPESRHEARELYLRVLAMHDNANCNCDNQLGTISESIIDRWLNLIIDNPLSDLELLDDPARFADLIGHLHGLKDFINPDKLVKIIKDINPGSTDPVKDFNDSIVKVEEYLNDTRKLHHSTINKNVKYDDVFTRGDILMQESELQFLSRTSSMSNYHFAGKRLIGSFSGNGKRMYGGGFVDFFNNYEWDYGEFKYPAFCVPPDPLRTQQVKTACLNLELIKNCRNVLGFSYNDVPPLRFEALIKDAKSYADRAAAAEKEFTQIRKTLEQHLLSVLQAEQSVSLSAGDVSLEALNIDLANIDIIRAGLQEALAIYSDTYYKELLAAGLSDMEKLALGAAWTSAAFSIFSAGVESISAAPALISAIVAGIGLAKMGTGVLAVPGAATTAAGLLGTVVTGGKSLAGASKSIASAASATSSAASMQASFERRENQWKYQSAQNEFHVQIAGQNLQQSFKRLEVAIRRHEIALLKHSFAIDALQFLNHRFFNRSMLIWMQRTMRSQYINRLHYAITSGFMAERALAFEMQNPKLRQIRFDYFNPSRDGLLGATQLQTDLAGLEHSRLLITQRKLQLSRTFSISQLFPIEFDQFRSSTGKLLFSTAAGEIIPNKPELTRSLEMFDREFPGHYMRLIKSVRITIVTLVSPVDGIKATLKNNGLSRVVVGPPYSDGYQEINVRRNPESVALSSPYEASGLFQLDYKDDLLLPFEGLGVATDWIFELPKAANHFDYRLITDILFTVDYTALESDAYRNKVIQQLNPLVSLDRPFSMRNQFKDAWEEFTKPANAQTPITIVFDTLEEDFPPNLENLKIDHVSVFFVCSSETSLNIDIELIFVESGTSNSLGGKVKLNDSFVSTRQPNTNSIKPLVGKKPFGNWVLTLEDNPANRKLIDDEKIDDILVVVTFSGKLPDWPVH